jgi:trk system potassium uptake protein TrkA
MPQIAVLSLSAFGRALVRALVQERCQVLAVDIDDNKVNAVRELVDEAVIADARDSRALEALRLHDYDVVVLALGEPLDTSLLAALYLRDLKAKRIMARAVSEDHRRLLQHLGVEEVIFPDADMAQRTAWTLSSPTLLDTFRLEGDVALVEIVPDEDIVGHTLAQLNLRQTYQVTVVAIRDQLYNALRLNPDPHTPITATDVLLVLGRKQDIRRLARRT